MHALACVIAMDPFAKLYQNTAPAIKTYQARPKACLLGTAEDEDRVALVKRGLSQ